jgi:hypothetical protein
MLNARFPGSVPPALPSRPTRLALCHPVNPWSLEHNAPLSRLQDGMAWSQKGTEQGRGGEFFLVLAAARKAAGGCGGHTWRASHHSRKVWGRIDRFPGLA